MPRKNTKQPPPIATVIGIIVMLFAIWLGYQVGAFNWAAKRLINHATTSMQQEAERQKATNANK